MMHTDEMLDRSSFQETRTGQNKSKWQIIQHRALPLFLLLVLPVLQGLSKVKDRSFGKGALKTSSVRNEKASSKPFQDALLDAPPLKASRVLSALLLRVLWGFSSSRSEVLGTARSF